eukprot:scaffold516_cov401-Prasinococcus_capsulatus_cf.AAC.15
MHGGLIKPMNITGTKRRSYTTCSATELAVSPFKPLGEFRPRADLLSFRLRPAVTLAEILMDCAAPPVSRPIPLRRTSQEATRPVRRCVASGSRSPRATIPAQSTWIMRLHLHPRSSSGGSDQGTTYL